MSLKPLDTDAVIHSELAQHAIAQMDALVDLCWQAHDITLKFWCNDVQVEIKEDDSPVTKADKEANKLIVDKIKQLTPNIAIVSEEGKQPLLDENATFWLIDPLDGTKSFISGSDEFTVNIALVEKRKPVLGILGVPAQGLLYKGVVGQGAHRHSKDTPQHWHTLKVQPNHALKKRVVASKSHRSPKLDAWLAQRNIEVAERIGVGSALKFAVIAENKADYYPRMGPTMEWDTAAGHAILQAAGGSITKLDGSPFLYGKEGYLNEGFLAQ